MQRRNVAIDKWIFYLSSTKGGTSLTIYCVFALNTNKYCLIGLGSNNKIYIIV